MNFKLKSAFKIGLLSAVLLTSCKDEETPEEENEVEVITDVVLKFTNTSDANDVVTAKAKDPDGAGIQELEILDTIVLDKSKTYTLTLDLLNALDPNDVESITEEVEEEGADHKFFFSFSNDAFSNPAGNGNFDTATDPLNYSDVDVNNDGIGLSTTWTTNSADLKDGTFHIRLQHQPEIKSSTSKVSDGDTDLDLMFVLDIK